MRRTFTRIGITLLCVVLLASMSAAPVAAQSDHDEEFLVELDADGNAEVAVTFAYDLDSEDEQSAFEELQENETARESLVDRFENRMAAVAAAASEATGREMSVGGTEVEFETADGVGIVTLSLEWENLAAVDGDRLTVTEPFASGFEPDRAFTVAAPDGYEITSATTEPSSSAEATATWEAGASLKGFELVAEPSSVEGGDDETADDGAGFGGLAALGALLAAAVLAVRRG